LSYLDEKPHRRFNPLTGEWVLVSPHRTKRPWLGKVENTETVNLPPYDPKCYLCPGNERAGGHKNPDYTETFVFVNDFSALLPEGGEEELFTDDSEFFRSEPVKGECRVICFSPRHDLTLSKMSLEAIKKVVDVWQEQLAELGEKYRWVQIFENRGEIMGASNPHPHGQIWASSFLPSEPRKENEQQRIFRETHGKVFLLSYLEEELAREERIVIEEEHWVVLVPFWAVWPFETMLLPKRHIRQLTETTEREKKNLARTLKKLLTKYDNLFETSFPYTMGWHGAPFDGNANEHWQLHAHFYPPLLRSATIRKFMVGYEMLAEPQRDITPEKAAERLKKLSEIHYSERK